MRRHWRTERRRLAALQRLAGDGQVRAAGAEALQADVLEALRSLGRDEREALLLLAWPTSPTSRSRSRWRCRSGPCARDSRVLAAACDIASTCRPPCCFPPLRPAGPPVPDLELLRAAAPPAAPPTPAARDHARAALDRRVVGVPAPRSARRRRWLLPVAAASAAAACAVVLALTVRGDEPASAATALRHAAAAAERQPAVPPLRAGQYPYTRSSDTWMTFAGGSQDVETGESTPMYGVMVPVERQIWARPRRQRLAAPDVGRGHVPLGARPRALDRRRPARPRRSGRGRGAGQRRRQGHAHGHPHPHRRPRHDPARPGGPARRRHGRRPAAARGCSRPSATTYARRPPRQRRERPSTRWRRRSTASSC